MSFWDYERIFHTQDAWERSQKLFPLEKQSGGKEAKPKLKAHAIRPNHSGPQFHRATAKP